MTMLSDVEIARQAIMQPIDNIAKKLGIPSESIEHYGRYKAKIHPKYLQNLPKNKAI